MIVWIIEHRVMGPCACGQSPLRVMDTVVERVRSSRESAVDWCRANFSYDKPDNPWWFAIYAEEVDGEMIHDSLFTVDRAGNELADLLMPDYAG